MVCRTQRVHYANRRRLRLIAVSFAITAVVFLGALTVPGDATGNVLMVLFALGSLFMAGRSLQLGVWLDESERRLIVKSWFRNRSASVDEVSHVDSGQQPAIVLRTGDILSIPGLEHGLIFELRDPSTQWGPILHDLGRRIRNLQAESG